MGLPNQAKSLLRLYRRSSALLEAHDAVDGAVVPVQSKCPVTCAPVRFQLKGAAFGPGTIQVDGVDRDGSPISETIDVPGPVGASGVRIASTCSDQICVQSITFSGLAGATVEADYRGASNEPVPYLCLLDECLFGVIQTSQAAGSWPNPAAGSHEAGRGWVAIEGLAIDVLPGDWFVEVDRAGNVCDVWEVQERPFRWANSLNPHHVEINVKKNNKARLEVLAV